MFGRLKGRLTVTWTAQLVQPTRMRRADLAIVLCGLQETGQGCFGGQENITTEQMSCQGQGNQPRQAQAIAGLAGQLARVCERTLDRPTF